MHKKTLKTTSVFIGLVLLGFLAYSLFHIFSYRIVMSEQGDKTYGNISSYIAYTEEVEDVSSVEILFQIRGVWDVFLLKFNAHQFPVASLDLNFKEDQLINAQLEMWNGEIFPLEGDANLRDNFIRGLKLSSEEKEGYSSFYIFMKKVELGEYSD